MTDATALVTRQPGLFDSELENDTLYALIEERNRLIEQVREFNRNQRKLRETWRVICAELEVTDGQRLVIKHKDDRKLPYVVEAKRRSGGGHNVPEWHNMGIGEITVKA